MVVEKIEIYFPIYPLFKLLFRGHFDPFSYVNFQMEIIHPVIAQFCCSAHSLCLDAQGCTVPVMVRGVLGTCRGTPGIMVQTVSLPARPCLWRNFMPIHCIYISCSFRRERLCQDGVRIGEGLLDCLRDSSCQMHSRTDPCASMYSCAHMYRVYFHFLWLAEEIIRSTLYCPSSLAVRSIVHTHQGSMNIDSWM